VTDVADVANGSIPGSGQLPPEVTQLRRRLLGYSGAAVDARLAELSMQLEVERSRADAAELALADTRKAIAAERHRPPPTLGDLAMHSAKVHRRAGAEAEATIGAAIRAARQLVRSHEIRAAQLLRKARHRAMDAELRARDTIEQAEADMVRLTSDASRDADRRLARAKAEGRMVMAEANAGVEMVRAERGLRLGRLRDSLDELHALRAELVDSANDQRARLAEVIARLGPA
jgi:hypothetical protein